jgi:thiol-disulfide isomerase/thioredoxin
VTSSEARRGLLIFALLVLGVIWALGPTGNPAIAPGAKLGEVAADLGSGGHFRLSEHRGQVVVLNFWASWCGPCRAEAPLLSRLHRSGVKVVGLTVEALPLATVAERARRIGMQYPVGVGPDAVLDRLGIRTVPTTCVIGKDGTVVASRTGLMSSDELDEAIAQARAR